MFYNSNNNRLFRDYSLDAVMRSQKEKLQKEIQSISFDELSKQEDRSIIEQLSIKYSINTPSLKLKDINVAPEEAEIEVMDEFNSRFGRGGTITVKGFRITVTMPFVGDKDAFRLQPSTWSSGGTPEAILTNDSLLLTYETREKDPEKIKSLWNSDINDIQQNLEWITRDLGSYNSSIEGLIQEGLNKRRKDAGDNQALFDQLKS